MARKIAWNDIPVWAQRTIKDTGNGFCQSNRDNGTLLVQFGTSYYNGVQVAKEGEIVDPADTAEETIKLEDTPKWVQKKIEDTKRGSTLQGNFNGVSLQVTSDGTAYYNSKKILR